MRKVKDFTLIVSARNSNGGREISGGDYLQWLQRSMDMGREERNHLTG